MKLNKLVRASLLASAASAYAVGAASVAMFAPTTVAAQDITSGRIDGAVVDSEGNAVPGATVVLSSEALGTSRTFTTGSTGTFVATQVPLGTYQLTISAPNYSTTRVDNVQSVLGGASYEVVLEATTASNGQEIVVSGERVRTVDFSGAATGAVFDVQKVASQLPVQRSLEGIALLAPQAVASDTSFPKARGKAYTTLAGSSAAENIYYINGMNVTNFRTFLGGSTVPFDFYDQIQVKTGGYQAEFGRATGGALIGVTRSGSNEFRGGFNFSYAPDSLRSTSPNTYINNNRADYTNEVEGNIYASGPIIKDRLFFFGLFNPRYSTDIDSTRADVSTAYTKSKRTTKTPFFGGKIDFQPFDNHRLEVTYFRDKNTEVEDLQTFDSANNALLNSGRSYSFEGGDNYTAKYTGILSDWLTVSALYGKSKFDQTIFSTQDADAAVYDDRTGDLIQVAGSPAFTVENGRDQREFYRGDVDVFANFLGDHHIRFGVDYEILTAVNQLQYSGGAYWRLYTAGPNGAFDGQIAPGEEYARLRILNSGGTFKSKNTAFYIQDNWDVTDRLQLSLGIRNDRFKNLNAAGSTFVDIKNQWAPRLGATYDVFGDRRTKLSGFFGRYYLPIAANTNIRLAGNELFTQQFFSYTSLDSKFVPQGTVALGDLTILSDSQNPNPATLVSTNLKPQYLDEFILGIDHDFGNGWKVGLKGSYRNLKSVLEDADLGVYAIPTFCAQNPAACGGEDTLDVGSGGYVLLNPGKDAIFYVDPQGGFEGGTLTIPASIIDLPKAKRKYWGLEFTFERQFDGVWGIQGSYTWSKSKGNYEGGVKSDNGQDDTGLTQDFDEPGWMDGAYGYLPNDRRHQFKIFGTWKPSPWFQLGMNARVISPRKFGCIGIYPFQDGRAQDPYDVGSNDSWYCGDRSTAIDSDGNGDLDTASGTVLVGRGRGFKSAWQKSLDLSFQITPPVEEFRNVTLRVDVFNVFNFKGGIDYQENGDRDSVISQLDGGGVSVPLDEDYGKVRAYQTPRYVRFGVSVDF